MVATRLKQCFNRPEAVHGFENRQLKPHPAMPLREPSPAPGAKCTAAAPRCAGVRYPPLVPGAVLGEAVASKRPAELFVEGADVLREGGKTIFESRIPRSSCRPCHLLEHFDRGAQLLVMRTPSAHDIVHANYKNTFMPSISGATGASRPTRA